MKLDVAVLASALGTVVGTVVISLSHFKEDAKEFIASTIEEGIWVCSNCL